MKLEETMVTVPPVHSTAPADRLLRMVTFSITRLPFPAIPPAKVQRESPTYTASANVTEFDRVESMIVRFSKEPAMIASSVGAIDLLP